MDDTATSTRAVSTAISKTIHIWRKCMSPGRYINRDQQRKTYINKVFQQHSEMLAKALLDDTAVSTSTVCQPQSEKREHIRRSCISSARCSCVSTAIKIKSESTSGRHSHFDLGGISTANSKAETNLAQLYITSAGYLYINTVLKIESESTSGRHSHFDLGGVSTTNTKAPELLAQLNITSAV